MKTKKKKEIKRREKDNKYETKTRKENKWEKEEERDGDSKAETKPRRDCSRILFHIISD